MGKKTPRIRTNSSTALTTNPPFNYRQRFEALRNELVNDLGGRGAPLSAAQIMLAEKAAFLGAEMERLEERFIRQGYAAQTFIDSYQRCLNSVRRCFESLGIHRGRIPKNLNERTLDDYLKEKHGWDGNARHHKRNAHHQSRVIDMEAAE